MKSRLCPLQSTTFAQYPEQGGYGKLHLEIDVGVKPENIRRIANAGADTFVAGSAIFNAPSYADVIARMRQALA